LEAMGKIPAPSTQLIWIVCSCLIRGRGPKLLEAVGKIPTASTQLIWIVCSCLIKGEVPIYWGLWEGFA